MSLHNTTTYHDPPSPYYSRPQSSSSSSGDPYPDVQSPTSYTSSTSSDSGLGTMSPPYQGWTPALAPIRGSPSYPAGTEVTASEREEEELEEDAVDQSYRTEHEDHIRERGEPHGVVIPTIMPESDIEQGLGPTSPTETDSEIRENVFKKRARGLMGGIMSGLRRIPEAMTKNSPRGSFYIPPSPPGGGLAEPPVMITNGSHLGDPGSPASLVSYPASSVLPPNPSSNGATASSDTSSQSTSEGTPQVPRRFRQLNDYYTPNVNPGSDFSSPQQVTLAELSGYEQAHTPFPFTNPADRSLGSYMDRIRRVFLDVIALPWVAPQVVEEYIPELDSSRGRHRQSDYSSSWYAPKGHKANLEEGEPEIKVISPPMPPAPVTPSPEYIIQTIPPTPTHSGSYSYYSQRSPRDRRRTLSPSFTERSLAPSEGGRTAIRPTRSPRSGVTSLSGFPSPGASSQGLGRHSITSSYHFASPTHLFKGFAPNSVMSTPQTRLESEGFLSPSLR